jgi:hypothetical protein
MQKKIRKLRLDRETLRNLDGEMTKVKGALDSHFDHTCGTVCDIETWHCSRCSLCNSAEVFQNQ